MDFPIWLSWLTFPLNHPSDNEISGSCANKPKEIQTFLYPVYPATAKHHPGKYLNTPNLPQKVPASTSMHINRIYIYIYIYVYMDTQRDQCLATTNMDDPALYQLTKTGWSTHVENCDSKRG